jgi:hypothetical protein
MTELVLSAFAGLQYWNLEQVMLEILSENELDNCFAIAYLRDITIPVVIVLADGEAADVDTILTNNFNTLLNILNFVHFVLLI